MPVSTDGGNIWAAGAGTFLNLHCSQIGLPVWNLFADTVFLLFLFFNSKKLEITVSRAYLREGLMSGYSINADFKKGLSCCWSRLSTIVDSNIMCQLKRKTTLCVLRNCLFTHAPAKMFYASFTKLGHIHINSSTLHDSGFFLLQVNLQNKIF